MALNGLFVLMCIKKLLTHCTGIAVTGKSRSEQMYK